MNETNRRLSADDIEALLPWYAAGTLGPWEAGQVEAALAADAELGRRLDLVREEMTEAIVLNEALKVPSTRMAANLFSAIDRERRTARNPAAGSGLAGWFADLFPPRILAFTAGVAVLLIAVEAGVIARLALQEHAPQSGGYVIQSIPSDAHTARRPDPGAFAWVSFSPQASMADVTGFLNARDATIVEGPTAGVYRVRIGRNYVAKEELDRLVKEFQSASNIVASAMPD
jgi:anti-sigma factor RsiW